MGRPEKEGLDYFPKDIDLDRDDKLSMIIGEFGFKGEMLYDKVLGWIYKHRGYFIEWSEEEQLKFVSRYSYCGFSLSFVQEVVPRFIKWGLFDRTVFNAFQILTSDRIQSTWLEATRKRNRRKIIRDIWLLDISDALEAEEMPKKAEESTQSKVKESKGNERKRANALVDMLSTEAQPNRSDYDKLIAGLKGKTPAEAYAEIKTFILEKKPSFAEPYVDIWNIVATSIGLTTVQVITDKRRQKLKTRAMEPEFDYFKILTVIRKEKFYQGESQSGWKVDFDHIIDSQTKYTRIIEKFKD